VSERVPPAPLPLRYLRARAIAELLDVDVRTVRRWIADGTLPSIKVGGARLVAEADLQRLLQAD
jgi:excisionase family DNA binding protein